MHIKQLDGYQRAIEHLQYLPEKQQMVVFDLIENFFEITTEKQTKLHNQENATQNWQYWLNKNQAFIARLGIDIDKELSEQQKSFLMWRANYEKILAKDDSWTNKQHDEFWASLKDKNDIGREVVFE